MSTLQSWRKAYGAIKDSTQVGLAKVNSEFKDLDVAIVKATNHIECPPKERHIRKIFAATAIVRPRADVAYCIHALARRLAKTHNWTVALKTLIVIHRTLREGDSTFKEELLNYAQRGYILQISNFKDDSSPLAWDCSAWIRTYALFLEERLECFRILRYDIEAERFTKSGQGHVKTHCKTRDLSSGALLVQMPALQQLLYRLVGCQPQGLALGNYLIQYALALVLKESFKIYCAINDGIINLVDVFFEMSRHEAVKALEIYKRAREQAENLSDFYDLCKGLELARNFQFPILRQGVQLRSATLSTNVYALINEFKKVFPSILFSLAWPPPSFLATMEEYIKEAPWTVASSSKRLEYEERNLLTYKTEVSSPKSPEPSAEVEENPIVEVQEEPETTNESDPPEEAIPTTVDLLGLNEISPAAALIEESNALALAILPSDGTSNASNPAELLGTGATGWELALVTTDTSNSTNLVGTNMAGGFDKLLLDSLYEDAEARKQQQPQYGVQQPQYGIGLGANPFDARDPFAMSYGIAPPTNVQMAQMVQQQNQMMMMMQGPYQFHPPHQAMAGNPFADPFTNYSNVPCTQQSSGLL